jgi:chemotaxis signal transduction protein
MSLPSKVIVFFLNHQAYAIDVAAVQEIRSYQYPEKRPVTPPPGFLGTINLRGSTLPLIDLRLYFGITAELTAFTVVLVVHSDDWVVGLVIDQINDVAQMKTDYTLCQLSGEAVSLPLCDYIAHTISTPRLYPIFLLDHLKLLRILQKEIAL